jgi:hypothetical protein
VLTAMKREPELAWLNEVSAVPSSRRCATSMPRSRRSSLTRPLPEVQVPARPPVRHLRSDGVPHQGHGPVAGQDEYSAEGRLDLAGHRQIRLNPTSVIGLVTRPGVGS